MDGKILVTSYLNPDLDGAASAIAYAYMLRKKGQAAETVLFGKPQPEVEFFTQKYGYHFPIESGDKKSRWDSFVVVDTSISKRLPNLIDPLKVVQIIDHHPAEIGEEFPRAKIQNEEVGAVATLIYERILQTGVDLPIEIARLIYVSIFHNTLNLLTGSCARDLDAIGKLENKYSFSREIVEEMFNYLNQVYVTNATETIKGDLKEVEIEGNKFVGGQMLVYGTDNLEKLKAELAGLAKEITGKVFMKIDDMKNNFTAIYSSDSVIKEKISRNMGIVFTDDWAMIRPLTLRKRVFKILADK